jgi:polysaccharide export outer membrane protein
MSSAQTRLVVAGVIMAAIVAATNTQAQSQAQNAVSSAAVPTTVTLPGDYVIGPEDVIGVLFWREAEMSGDQVVRPDGMITVPLIGDIRAAGLRPDELREQLMKAAGRYLTDPNVAVVARQINSRKVFITGQVATPGAYPLTGPRSVIQVIALAGGLSEYADSKNIILMRMENGRQRSYRFSYKDVSQGKALPQNLQLLPGDTIIVP